MVSSIAEARLPIRPFLRPQQVLVYQGRHAIQDARPAERGGALRVRADRLSRLQGAAAREGAKPAEERLFRLRQQVVAPGQGGPQGLVALRRVLRATRQQRQPSPSRASNAWGEKSLSRADASSSARGSPSSRRQMVATAWALVASTVKAGR